MSKPAAESTKSNKVSKGERRTNQIWYWLFRSEIRSSKVKGNWNIIFMISLVISAKDALLGEQRLKNFPYYIERCRIHFECIFLGNFFIYLLSGLLIGIYLFFSLQMVESMLPHKLAVVLPLFLMCFMWVPIPGKKPIPQCLNVEWDFFYDLQTLFNAQAKFFRIC